MKEVKPSRKPLIFYYFVVLLVVLLFNMLVMPVMTQQSVTEVDYGKFMTMAERHQIGEVQIQDKEIYFTSKDGETVYMTGKMDDPNLVSMLRESGAKFSQQVVNDTASPLINLLSWILPFVLFIAIGQYMSKKLLEKAGGGGNAMMFGMGKSNAKIYVHSTEGISFDDVAGEDEAKENLSEIVEYLHDPEIGRAHV